MSRSLRVAFIAVIVALTAGWFGLRAQNAALEQTASPVGK